MMILHDRKDEITDWGAYYCRTIRLDGPTKITTSGMEIYAANEDGSLRYMIWENGTIQVNLWSPNTEMIRTREL